MRFFHLRMVVMAACLCSVASGSLQAQTKDYEDRKSTAMLSIGAGFGGGLSMSFDPPTNWKVKPVFAYHAGLDVLYPLTPVVGASLGLGVDSRATKYHWYNDNTLWEIRRVNYFTVTPGFQFSAFYLGCNFGFPLNGTRSWQNFQGDRERTFKLDSDADSLNVMIEPRIGAVIPVLDEEIGWLGITVMAAYNVSDLSDKSDFLPADTRAKATATQTATLQLGFTWQFGIPGTERNK